MNALSDGLMVLASNWQLILGVLFFVLASQPLLRSIFGGSISTGEYISLGFAGWVIVASLLSLLWAFIGTQKLLWIGIPFLLIFIFSLPRLKSDPKPVSPSTTVIFAVALFFSILLRLTFVSGAIFPSYFDSAFHFSLANNLVNKDVSWMLNWLSANYYHVNFHIVTAFLASVFHTEVTQVMLILGQVLLTLLPFTLFFPIKRVTRSNAAAWFAVILSAFGWYMPAHAMDWGKYPALMSLGMIVFVPSLVYLLLENKNVLSKKKLWAVYCLLGSSILLTVFTHSRSLIVFGIVFLVRVAIMWWNKLLMRWQSILFVFVSFVIILLTVFIQRQDILAPLFDPYLVKGLWITVLVLLLAIFALKMYSRFVFVCLLLICFLLISLFIPVGGIIYGREYLTLLDRPFVEMILFLPLSLLGGLGVAGLERKPWGRYVGLLAIGIVAVNAYFTYDLYPSDCCVIVGKDDVVAMDWAANQLPVKARIGISSTDVKVNVANVVEGVGGSDAGIWVTPLTGLFTVPLPFNTEFDQPSALEQICELRISHLYVGEVGQTFDDARLRSRPEWYKPLLSMPKAGVYEVIGCG